MAGLKFQGKLHSGMDDVENMAKLLLRIFGWIQNFAYQLKSFGLFCSSKFMVEDGCTGIGPNEEITFSMPFFKPFEGKSMDGEAHRFEKLLTGGANQNTFAARAGCNANLKPRKVALVTKSNSPVVDNSFAEKLKQIPKEIVVEKNVGEDNAIAKVEEKSSEEMMVTIQTEDKLEKQVEKVEQTEQVETDKSTVMEVSAIKLFKREQLLKIGVGFLASQDSEEYKRIALPIKNEIVLKLGNCQDRLSPKTLKEITKMSTGWCPQLTMKRPFAQYNKNNNKKADPKQEKKKPRNVPRPSEKPFKRNTSPKNFEKMIKRQPIGPPKSEIENVENIHQSA